MAANQARILNAMSEMDEQGRKTMLDTIKHLIRFEHWKRFHPQAVEMNQPAFRVYTDAELDALPQTEPDWVIPRLLTRQNLMVLAGEPKKACKSWLLLNMACDLAEGKPVWGVCDYRDKPYFQSKRPMRVVYFGLEDTADDIKARRQAMKENGHPISENLILVPKDPAIQLYSEVDVNRIGETLARYEPLDLIIFDPLRNLHGEDENSSQTMTRIKRCTDRLCRAFDCSALISHHEGKPHRDDPKERRETPYAMRGSTALYGAADAIAMVVNAPGKGRPGNTHRIKINFTLKRSGHISPVVMSVDTDAGTAQFGGFIEGRDKDAK